ncbi:hypothetical protein ATE47_04025 [Chryseobacterium sp. IHB B 17019]|uniref:hypothetical protein n=1 Tax=Chryseobacterium sp. IHB B 17019 TaxID=1721091 RepID=UPI0007228938|nr:hypothetical protein [Chryseobacterium sp. IHB B 17019]ALR29737.1 hypothetical protein ATE47_04025 [Chryseobacterium sp. IHB B 17019]
MNDRISKLFSCCLNNRVVIIDTNFKGFHATLKKMEPTCNSDRWYIEKFKEGPEFSQIINGKEYYFQRLV